MSWTKEDKSKGNQRRLVRQIRKRRVEKREALGRDSTLGYIISLQEIDLSWLIDENHFIVPCIILYSRYKIDLDALTNTRANGFAFINTIYTIDIAKFLNIKATWLEKPITIKGFDGKYRKAIIYILILYLSLDRQQQTNISFCILDLGNHNIILGLK